MKSLYAYFGLLDLHNIDSPGHSLYQIGLVDSLRESYGEEKFDFYSYYPEEVINSADLVGFPDTELGKLFHKYRTDLFDKPIHNIDEVLQMISEKKYSKLYLKARFRNLSTLSKKWKDALDFERIIKCAVAAGYSKDQIIILDTDLSLSDKFIEFSRDLLTIRIPSIHFPGISRSFLNDCVSIHQKSNSIRKESVFYGNIDTSKYKSGNSKSTILLDTLNLVREYNEDHTLLLICKANDYDKFITNQFNTYHFNREDRLNIWRVLESSKIMINVTKDKYDTVQFIPARIFEAMIFGMIPVSYKFDFLCPAFSFNTIEDLQEIYEYLFECNESDLKKAYLHFINSYNKHIATL
jgi:hypothetical protein